MLRDYTNGFGPPRVGLKPPRVWFEPPWVGPRPPLILSGPPHKGPGPLRLTSGPPASGTQVLRPACALGSHSSLGRGLVPPHGV